MPKTNAESCREYRQRKRKNKIKMPPKSSTERVREYRARQRALLNFDNDSCVTIIDGFTVEYSDSDITPLADQLGEMPRKRSLEAKAADRERKRRGRAAESAEEKQIRRELDAARQRIRRAAESAEEQQIRRESVAASHRIKRAADGERKRRARAAESAEEQIRREWNAARQRIRRAAESAEEQQIRREWNAARQRIRRAAESAEEQQIRRESNAARQRISRAATSAEEQQIRREWVAARSRIRRAAESAEEQQIRKELDAARHRIKYRERQNRKGSRLAARDFEHNNPEEYNLGRLDCACGKCGALHFASEKTTRNSFSTCCNSGKFFLPLKQQYPEFLKNLLSGSDDVCKQFKKNIRKYNSAFAFASFGFQSPEFLEHGPPVFVIHGQVYHRTAAAINPEAAEATYAQLYMLDPEFALTTRMQNVCNSDLSRTILQEIDSYLRIHNPFAGAYRMMKDLMELHRYNPDCYIKMWIVKDRQTDPRSYNLPVVNEVAAVFVSTDDEPTFIRDFAVHSSANNEVQQLSITSPNCDPCTYPILFPHGEPGWQVNLRSTSGSKQSVTLQDYYGFLIQERKDYFNPLLHSGKLTEQYIVDAFLKIEASRLHWSRTCQNNLRVDLYLGLMDYVTSHAQEENLNTGKICILPSSFYGSKRAMYQNYQDAMAMVARYGKPDLFITFTCNPKWKEIQEALKPGETATDRPDIVATVFHLNLKQLLDDLIKDEVLGKVTAYQYVIEFQKRGLPSCHMLLILANEDKPRQVEDVDSIVSAEIPDKLNSLALFNIVTDSMMHGPCGIMNPNAPCMDEIKGERICTKGFPKQFTSGTEINVDGYPKYRRRDNGVSASVRGQQLDNRWVVPYNPYLTKKFNAHINVEICSSVKSVKYIFKYIHKGHDAAEVRFARDVGEQRMDWDEIQHYIDSRYLTAPEAIWRIRGYKLYDTSHAIIRLPVHLPYAQSVVFQDGQEQEVLEIAQKRGTELTAFFALNRSDPNARQYYYYEIPSHYIYDKQSTPRIWLPRKKENKPVLPRLYNVSPKDSERFAVKLLLLHVKGPTSFEDLRTVEGIVRNTFKEAAVAHNLLEDDELWRKTLVEAIGFQMPVQLRMLFATILVNCEPADPKTLYTEFAESLREDFSKINDDQTAEHLALSDIEDNLMQFDKNMRHFGLPTPERNLPPALNIQEQATARDLTLNEMKTLYTEFAESLRDFSKINDDQTAEHLALSDIEDNLKQFDKNMRHFGLPTPERNLPPALNIQEQATARDLTLKEMLAKNPEQLNAYNIIMDSIETPDQTECFYLCGSAGTGKTFLCSALIQAFIAKGYKVMCVAPTGLAATILYGGQTVHSGFAMPLNLDKNSASNIRQGSAEWNALRETRLIIWDEISMCHGNMLEVVNRSLQDLMNNPEPFGGIPIVVGGDFGEHAPVFKRSNNSWQEFRKITLTQNMRVDANEKHSVDKIECCEDDNVENYTMEFVNSLTPMGMAPYRLSLKVGCCVMLLRDLNPKMGLCDGTRLIVKRIGEHNLECTIFSGDKKGTTVIIPRIIMHQTEDTEIPFSLRRKQFPLQLADNMTITGSQGQTVDFIGVYLPDPVFTNGQLYTAVSRVKRQSGLKIKCRPSSSQG